MRRPLIWTIPSLRHPTVGCVQVSFTTVLDRFKHTDAVSTCRKRIQIADRAQLERLVGQRSDPPGDL